MEKMNKKISNKACLIIGIIIIALIVVLAVVFWISSNAPDTSSNLSIGESPVLGEENAPVVIYEFSDFSCPYCAAAEGSNEEVMNYLKSRMSDWEAPLPLVKEKYVKTGKAKIVFKYFPGHGAGVAAYAVALGLNEQNPELFWKFAEKAFAEQNDLNDLAKMKLWAKDLGADEEALSAYLDSNNYNIKMKEDKEMGIGVGIQGTPTFIINGKMLEGAQSFSSFEDAIEEALAERS